MKEADSKSSDPFLFLDIPSHSVIIPLEIGSAIALARREGYGLEI